MSKRPGWYLPLYLPQEMGARLDEYATSVGRTKTDCIREAVSQWLESRRPKTLEEVVAEYSQRMRGAE